jgi:PAS domain S-box-containing protein
MHRDDRRPVVLNVDDHEAGRYALSRLLRREGFEVLEAGTGEEALELAKRYPDLVLLDVNLPDISGREVCRKIKSDPHMRRIPVLHISAIATSAEDRAAGLEDGADAYLTHPIDPPLLFATIRALLRVRQAEAEARDAALRWRTTFDAIGHGLALVDRDGRVRQINRAMEALVGKPAAELVGMSYDALLPGGAKPAGGCPFERARDSGEREVAEVHHGNRWFEITADPVLDERGEFSGAVRSMMEITSRRLAMEERERLVGQLESERARLEGVLRQLPAGVVIVEAPSGRIVLSNSQVEALLGGRLEAGLRMEEAVRRQAFRGGGQKPYPVEEWPLARSMNSGEVCTGEEIEMEGSDGTRATLLVSSAPIRDRKGFIVAAVATLLDVTDRKQLEEQFRKAQKMEAMGRLAGGVAHDFNNLLTIINGYGQMVMDALADSPIRRDMEAIMEASGRAIALTRQLLTFSRRQVVQPKVLDLNTHVRRMNRMLRRLIGEDIRLETALRAQPARVRADPGQLEQVVLNIVVNARDAMPDGGRLSIETANAELDADSAILRRGLSPGTYVVLAIGDTGEGMPADVQRHLFEPFFTTKPKGKGTGLGLSTVYGIVKQSGGEVLVDSEVGRGSTFRIYFPLIAEAARHAEPRVVEAKPRRGTETILLVEDEADVRRLTGEMLSRQGYSVLQAASGGEALRLWREHRASIDLVLTDVIMPEMSGRELADQLKSARADIRVMYMSGYTDDVIARHGVLDAGSAFVQKPFTPEALARKVRAVLDGEG